MHLRVMVCAALILAVPQGLRAQAPLRFVGDRDYPPLSFVENGVPRGFDIDVLEAIARKLGREIRIDLVEWADAQRAVIAGEADGLTDLAMSDERRTQFEFADPTVTHRFGLFVRAGDASAGSIDGVVGKAVGVTQGGFPREFFSRRPGVRLVTIGNYSEGFDRLLAGSLDAVAADVWPGALTVEERGLDGVVLGGEPFASLPASIAVLHSNASLLVDINEAIRELRADGTLQQIEQRWRPKQMVFLSRDRVFNVVAWGIGAALAALLIAVTIWALTLRRQMRERRQVEGELAESHNRLGLALAAASMGTWQWSAATNLEMRDANLNRILGLAPIASAQVLDDSLRRIHSEDREALVAEFLGAASGATVMREFRVSCDDGSIRTLRGRGKVFRDASGVHDYATGVVVDITAETAAMEHGRLLTHALQSASDVIVITDATRHIIYANDAFTRAFEYTEAEILGRHVSCLNAPGAVSLVSSEDADGWRGEELNMTKSGRLIPVSLAMSVVRNQISKWWPWSVSPATSAPRRRRARRCARPRPGSAASSKRHPTRSRFTNWRVAVT